jgi:hypothetical protein
MSLHFAQKHVYAGSGEHAWFANLDPKTQLRDKADLGDDDGGSEPSYRALFSRLLVQHVVNKVRIKVPIEASGKRLFKIGGKQICSVRSRRLESAMGVHEHTVYQPSHPKISVQRLRSICRRRGSGRFGKLIVSH